VEGEPVSADPTSRPQSVAAHAKKNEYRQESQGYPNRGNSTAAIFAPVGGDPSAAGRDMAARSVR
jgi:hypothetical protein